MLSKSDKKSWKLDQFIASNLSALWLWSMEAKLTTRSSASALTTLLQISWTISQILKCTAREPFLAFVSGSAGTSNLQEKDLTNSVMMRRFKTIRRLGKLFKRLMNLGKNSTKVRSKTQASGLALQRIITNEHVSYFLLI